MGAITYDIEVASSLPAAKMYNTLVVEGDALITKIMPHVFQSVEMLEGDGGVGSIKLLHLGEGAHHNTIKHRVDAIDKDNFTYSYTIIEGDALSDALESITYHIKIVPTDDGGCICKNRSIYNTKGDAEISQDEIKEGKQKAIAILNAFEAYIHANPNA